MNKLRALGLLESLSASRARTASLAAKVPRVQGATSHNVQLLFRARQERFHCGKSECFWVRRRSTETRTSAAASNKCLFSTTSARLMTTAGTDQVKVHDTRQQEKQKTNYQGARENDEDNLTQHAESEGHDHSHAHDHKNTDDDDDEMMMEDMFVEPHDSFSVRMQEWGGPTRGGKYLEPTRFGDWERKGRCTDF